MLTTTATGQFNKLLRGVFSSEGLFKELRGEFKPILYEGVVNETNTLPYVFAFSNRELPINFYRTRESELTDTSCNYFVINRQQIVLKGKFVRDFACDMDVSSFKVYNATLNSRKYLLISGITSGSGVAGTTVILLLFDVTDLNSIKYFPLWTKFGDALSFSDFNNDGNLDFIDIKPYQDRDHFKANFTTLRGDKFITIEGSFKVLRYDGESLKTVKAVNFPY